MSGSRIAKGLLSSLRAPAPRILRTQLPSGAPPLLRLYRTKAKAAEPKKVSTMQAANRLKTVFDSGKPSIGAWQMLPGSNISRVLARSGVDWVLVDMEHGNIDDSAMHEAVPAIAALGVSPIVRTPDIQGWMIKRALDSGAHGVLVPLLRTVEEAKELVQAAKFPQKAVEDTEVRSQANDAILTMVQIETKEALEAIDEIAAVDGIDVLFIGPFDLGNNLGYPMQTADGSPELRAAISKILTATKKAGKKAGIFATSGEQGKRYVEQGFDMISVTVDYSTLELHTKQQVSLAQSGAK
ncbi:4-hydroxy-2-oxo-heptane-1,7-dioate aldolase [Cladobotryum mycophilum]|uniref:4-hydroxy-2-oxo-heptane-1,7-dioate aldolase n=1 Tax=Cladobotryum mycophilum TaxID=491253 RepID=A0ABR0S563_9HYPO